MGPTGPAGNCSNGCPDIDRLWEMIYHSFRYARMLDTCLGLQSCFTGQVWVWPSTAQGFVCPRYLYDVNGSQYFRTNPC
ncbi:MAG: hypothetical protein LBS11_03280 [Oscillospiraceae bacterium]|jgi:hypothetical protein|nr:hypothetical protein [Oscillospiraceae bacterium]